MSDIFDIPDSPPRRSMSPIIIDIPDSPPRHSSDPGQFGIHSNLIPNSTNSGLAPLNLESLSPFSVPEFSDDIDIPQLPDSPPRLPLDPDIEMYDIPASQPPSPRHIYSIPDSPPRLRAGLPLLRVSSASPTPPPLTRRKTSPPVLPQSPRPFRRLQT